VRPPIFLQRAQNIHLKALLWGGRRPGARKGGDISKSPNITMKKGGGLEEKKLDKPAIKKEFLRCRKEKEGGIQGLG